MFLFLGRAALGPTVYDRLLATNAFGTKTVIFVALLGFFAGRPEFLDMALVYALINFVTTVAVLKLVQEARLDR
ncbi:MAG: pH regulation protein F [Planctomycetes bacterium]|nr:pH regulation protein F [Planctomycetota bacterium]